MKSTIVFSIKDPSYICPENEIANIPDMEIIKISKDGFYYKGERVDDIHNVYARFNEWLKLAEK